MRLRARGCLLHSPQFSSTIAEKFKKDHKLLIIFVSFFFFFFFKFYNACFPAGLALIAWSFPLRQRDAQVALEDVSQHEGKHRFLEALV